MSPLHYTLFNHFQPKTYKPINPDKIFNHSTYLVKTIQMAPTDSKHGEYSHLQADHLRAQRLGKHSWFPCQQRSDLQMQKRKLKKLHFEPNKV